MNEDASLIAEVFRIFKFKSKLLCPTINSHLQYLVLNL